MDNDKIISLIQALNNLLIEQSLHKVSYEFDKVAEVLRKENLKVAIVESKAFYLIEELALIHEKKNEAQTFEAKAMWREKEKELLSQYLDTEASTLKYEPSFFEYKDARIMGYLCKDKENERLIWNLIEGYLLKEKNLLFN